MCADNVTARECCEQKGDFKEGESCSNDPCPCDETGACCGPCDNDEAVLGVCYSNRTRAQCAALGGDFNVGVQCGSGVCPECIDDTIYEAKVACCEECPNGTNTGRNGQCVTKSATGLSISEALQKARDLCAGTLGQEEFGKAGSGVPDPCASGNGGCPDCSSKTRPYCLFCPAVTNTNCISTQSGECIEVEVDFGGEIVDDPGTGQIVYNPTGNTDLTCADIAGGPFACSGSDVDCVNCQNICCCQNGEVNSIPINGGEVCDGETILLESGQACDPSEVECLLDNFCIECDGTSICDENSITDITDPGSGNCVFEINPEFGCQVVNTNEACPGFERPSDSDVLGPVDCDAFGAGSNPSANGGCGCGNCDLSALQLYIFNNALCQPTLCDTCDSCNLTLLYGGGLAGCGSATCCRDTLPPDPDSCGNIISPP